MVGNNLIWLRVLGTYLSILDHFGFKGAIRTTLEPRGAGGWDMSQLHRSALELASWCDTAVLNDRAPLLNSPTD